MRRLAVASVVSLIASLVLVMPAAAQWPTTCVELNDLAEAAAGRHHNVGIYQRSVSPPSLEAAEAACQHDHRSDVQQSFAWALGSQGGDVSGIWPTSCVELNDLAEAARGDPRNVGIYQRIFVHDFEAERACRSDHRADVQQTFAWAAPAQAQAPAPAPPPAPDPSTNADYPRVRDAAIARGASYDVALTVAADVIGRGTVSRFLHGTDDGVLYGRYSCEWQSNACPLAPVYVPPPPPAEPRIASALRPAWDLLMSTPVGSILRRMGGADSVTVEVGHRPNPLVGAWYSRSLHLIVVNQSLLLGERRSVVASVLAHELWHAVSPIPFPRDYTACIADEVWAKIVASLVWQELEGVWPPSSTHYEASLTGEADLRYEDGRRGAVLDFDTDVYDWTGMWVHVSGLYQEQCNHP